MSSPNLLIHETSPYLLQHAHNPVNWMPYGTLAFKAAMNGNKPMLISIGYSSCHWCHVMEHESFENEAIAKLMNDYFVCVKVDREERPDVDHVYMDAVQQIHGNGGWPLNCFALPDGKPFWGGTYFRPEQWKQVLLQIHELFQTRLADIQQQANELSEGIQRQNYLLSVEPEKHAGSVDFGQVYGLLNNAFDVEKGGLRGAPKFPMPVVLQFVMKYGLTQKVPGASEWVDLTLQKMACGGIYDQAGGGFARYSTDSDWKVPHFEKMLYDNAQLVSVYSAAFQLTGNVLYRDVIEQTLQFVKRELTAPEGVFYSALDADSEGGEGLFYTWTSEQFNEALGHYASLAGEYFGVGARGLWEHGRSILHRPGSDALFAQQHFLSAGELASLVDYCRVQLLNKRSQRTRPGLDDKMLLGWNSLMISALVDASIALSCAEYREMAIQAAGFILNNLKRPDKGLFHTWKEGRSHINAFLDDYAFTIEALLKLYSTTTSMNWLHEAESLAWYAVNHFYDSHSGFFWYSENDEQKVFARKIDVYDGVMPCGNSAMAHILNTLGVFLDKQDFIDLARRMIHSMENRIARYPSAHAHWASLALSVEKEQYVTAVVGENAVSIIAELIRQNIFNTMVFGSTSASPLPYFENRYVDGKTLIYVCSGSYCMPPVETVDEAVALIRDRN